jgi:diguanylate cyclase (GGDEF)-like protein
MNNNLAIAPHTSQAPHIFYTPYEPDASTPAKTILIVDDTAANLRVLLGSLTQNGYEVQCAKSGAMALIGVQANPPDLILLDVCMPGINGYEVCQQLKANLATKDIPVIFLSALDHPLDKVKAFEMGGADYITKPFQMEEVLVRVKHQLTIRHLQQQQQQLIAALEQANQQLQVMATLDGLTQIANRRRFDEYLLLEWHRAAREQTPLSLILADIDHFKRYNDTCGHLAGDRCLQVVADTLSQVVQRPADLLARYGGEEFAILLPNTELPGALQLAERIRLNVEQLVFADAPLPVCKHISLSLGVASTIPTVTASFETLVATADRAMYEAKAKGRNRVCGYPKT